MKPLQYQTSLIVLYLTTILCSSISALSDVVAGDNSENFFIIKLSIFMVMYIWDEGGEGLQNKVRYI